MKRSLLSLVLAFMLVVAFGSVSLADNVSPGIPPTLKLEVTQSPLAVYPPIMIYTATLSPIPIDTSRQIIIDFYNAKYDPAGIVAPEFEYIGSAVLDPTTGQAKLAKSMYPGVYVAYCMTKSLGEPIYSEKVIYKVQ